MRYLVTGASGFIGHHLCKYLKDQGHWVRGVDWKQPEYGCECDEFMLLDLREYRHCEAATEGIERVFNLAADMGGMGFIQDPTKQSLILENNLRINMNMLSASRKNGVKRYLFSSSACVYPNYMQTDDIIKPLKEEDAYPADPQDTYGWEKLMTEILLQASKQCYGTDIRIVRFHNIYGPEGTWKGGREKAPAAMCRKVIEAIKSGKDHINIWGNGYQSRSFCYIEDCLKGLDLIMNGDNDKPVNLGRNDAISINDLARMTIELTGHNLKICHIDGPIGVRGRNSDNTFFKQNYGWEPEISMQEGMEKTLKWIKSQMDKESQ